MALFHKSNNLYKVPSMEEFKRLEKMRAFTPDLVELEEKPWHLVFSYDDTMSGHGNHDIIGRQGIKQCIAFTVDPFTLFKKKLGKETFPIAISELYQNVPFERVKGELWAIKTSGVKELDILNYNGLYFLRKRLDVVVPFKRYELLPGTSSLGPKFKRENRFTVLNAWMYQGIPGMWNTLIDNGYLFKPVRIYNPKILVGLHTYYFFTKEELNE